MWGTVYPAEKEKTLFIYGNSKGTMLNPFGGIYFINYIIKDNRISTGQFTLASHNLMFILAAHIYSILQFLVIILY